MKTNNIYGIQSYYALFKSPVSTNDVKPLTSFMNSAISSQIYAKNFANKIQSSFKSYLSSINKSTEKLKEASKSFLDENDESILTKKTIYTTDKNSLEATATSKAVNRTYTLKISQLAQNQKNEGYGLTKQDNTMFNIGKNTFTINKSKTSSVYSINIEESDSGQTILEKIAKTINDDGKSTISANIETSNDINYLRLSSPNTGYANSFTIDDIEGNIVSASGINIVAQESRDAKYSVDGKEFVSSNNEVALDDGNLKISLKEADNNDLKLTVDINREGIKHDIEKLVENFNSLIEVANSNLDNFSGALTIKKELHQIVHPKSASLENIGIYYNTDGTLKIDYDRLEAAIERNMIGVQSAFNSVHSIADKFNKKGSEIISSPYKYSKPASFDKSYEDYVNYMKLTNNSTSLDNYYYKGIMLNTLL